MSGLCNTIKCATESKWVDIFCECFYLDFIIPKEIPFFVVVADLLIFQTGDAEYVEYDA